MQPEITAPKPSRLNVGLVCVESDAVLTSPFSPVISFSKNMENYKKIFMYPDYGGAVFWDEYGCNIGGYNYIEIDYGDSRTIIDPFIVKGLKEWFVDWDAESLYHTNHWTDAQWKDWWLKGLELAKTVKALLPKDVILFYFTLKDPIWKIRPEDSYDGIGLFDEGEPIKID